jgi:hypothetical protein
MSDKIIILKHTKTGFIQDTIVSPNDTLRIDVSSTQTIEIPSKPIPVETPGKDWFDYSLGGITILGAVIAAIYTLKSIKKLFEKDELRELQISKLTNIVESLDESNKQALRREKLSKRPFISLNFKQIRPNQGGGSVILDILNNNPMSNVISFQVHGIQTLGFNSYVSLTPGNSGNTQSMGIQLYYTANIPTTSGVISIDYTTEEGFEYIHEINVSYDSSNGQFIARGLQIILKDD